MRVQRELDHEKLGLSHIQFFVRADPELEPLFFNRALLSGVWEKVYVNSVYRIIPDDLFYLDHLAPPSLHPKLRDFYRELEALGALKVHQTYECNRLTHSRMWVKDYNWDVPGWDFDWSRSSPVSPHDIEDPPPSSPVKFDKTDLLLVQGFQSNYDHKIAEVADNCSIGRDSAFWHFREHVEARGLFGAYRIDWLGTGRGLAVGSVEPQQRQSSAAIAFIARDLSSEEMANARAHLHSIPYLWSELVGASDYKAETLIPLQSLMEAFRFFSKVLKPLEGRARIITADQSESVNYSIHTELFDDESKRWTYDGDVVVEGIRAALAGGVRGSGSKVRGRRRAGLSSGA